MSLSRSKNAAKSKTPSRGIAAGDTPDARAKALQSALGDIEKAYGTGSIMRLGDKSDLIKKIEGISTGSINLDLALGGCVCEFLPEGRWVALGELRRGPGPPAEGPEGPGGAATAGSARTLPASCERGERSGAGLSQRAAQA